MVINKNKTNCRTIIKFPFDNFISSMGDRDRTRIRLVIKRLKILIKKCYIRRFKLNKSIFIIKHTEFNWYGIYVQRHFVAQI